MSDHIPFEIQAEIMKKLPVKSLIRFRSVSKPWKSLIESSNFINNYHINNTQPQHRLFVQYNLNKEQKYISITDDNTFPNQKSSLTFPGPLSILGRVLTLSSMNGLLCFYGVRQDVAGHSKMVVLWNPTVRKSVGIPIPNAMRGHNYIGFGVCPNTSDPKLVRINTIGYEVVSWEVEVYRLNTRIWKTVSNFPPAFKPCHLKDDHQVFVGGFIYWSAFDNIRLGDKIITSNLIVSFGLKNDEFGDMCLPDRLVHSDNNLRVAKVYESLGLLEYYRDDGDHTLSCGVWVMKEGVAKSFTKMFIIKPPPVPDHLLELYRVLEFRNNGDAIIEYFTFYDLFESEVYRSLLEVYEPCSGHTNGLGINGKCDSFSVKSYMETLLLLDHSDSVIH